MPFGDSEPMPSENKPLQQDTPALPADSTTKEKDVVSYDNIYKVTPENWYSTFPYGFRFSPRDGSGSSTFYLPINPSDMNTTTHFATNVVTTLYGVVEEHSEVRFYDIQINGTTGFVPRYVNAVNEGSGDGDARGEKADQDWKGGGRGSFSVAAVSSLGGFLPQLTNIIDQAKDTLRDLKGENVNKSGVFVDNTGYLAFHNFYRFLLKYKKNSSGEEGFERRTQHPLTWLNYKDGTKYDCVINGFSMTRSASDPYLYNYSLSMRCYNLRSIDLNDQGQVGGSEFGLGAGDISTTSLFSKISSKVSSAASLVNSVAGFF